MEIPWPYLERGRHLSSSAISPECIELIKSWLRLCASESHPQCTAGINITGDLPDRIIKIDPSGGLRLMDNAEHQIKGQYAALSHRWGGGSRGPSQLTDSNYDQLKQDITLSSLSKNFEDAVTVCLALDIEYLWIDSLCIIQNDKAEKEVQIPRMA